MELTLQEAALLFEVELDDLTLALTALWSVKKIERRLVKRDGKIETYYRREDLEEAFCRFAAQRLGFVD